MRSRAALSARLAGIERRVAQRNRRRSPAESPLASLTREELLYARALFVRCPHLAGRLPVAELRRRFRFRDRGHDGGDHAQP
jgi:hypothetical protein